MKYMGSKARLAKDLSPIINDLISKNGTKVYIEPFVGGANMIQHIECDEKIGADNNHYLIAMWNAILKGWTPPSVITKEMYRKVKESKESYAPEMVAVTGFCATYNAKWFGGYAGLTKTKIGTVRDYYDESIRNILKQSAELKDVKFISEDYRFFSDFEDALIYCDPPYKGVTKYGSNDFDHDSFWDWVRMMSERNTVLVSEYDAPEDFVSVFDKKLTTTLDKNSRKSSSEKLFIMADKIN